FAEVVRARAEGAWRIVPAEAPARLHEVHDGIVALEESLADLGLRRFLRIHSVPAEALAQAEHVVGLHLREQRIEYAVRRRCHGSSRSSHRSRIPVYSQPRADASARHDSGMSLSESRARW